MGQILHGSAATTHAVRAAIQRQAAIDELRVLLDKADASGISD